MFVSGSSVLLSFLSRPTFINLLLLPLYFEVGTKMSSFDQSRSSNHEIKNDVFNSFARAFWDCALKVRLGTAFLKVRFGDAFWGCVLRVRLGTAF